MSRPLECTDCGTELGARDAGDPTLHALYAAPICYGCHRERCERADRAVDVRRAFDAGARIALAFRRAIAADAQGELAMWQHTADRAALEQAGDWSQPDGVPLCSQIGYEPFAVAS